MSRNRKGLAALKTGMTPLIDVVFLLIIFFMLSTEFQKPRIVSLQFGSDTTEEISQEHKYLTVKVDKEGKLTIRGVKGDVVRHVRQQMVKNPEQSIILEVTKEALVQDIMTAIDTMRRNGATNIVMM